MITEELDPNDLSKRIRIGERILDSSIKNLKLYMNDKTKFLTASNSKALYDLVIDWREFVQLARLRLSNSISKKSTLLLERDSISKTCRI